MSTTVPPAIHVDGVSKSFEIPPVVHAVHDPIAAPRSSPSNVAVMIASELGTSSAAATPCNARKAISTPGSGATAHISEVAPNPATPTANTRRRPSRSPSDPPTSTSAPIVSR
jgi:hypothetical protein